MSVATEIQKPTISQVFLLEVTADKPLDTWALDTGSTYKVATTLEIINVLENGSSLTEQASAAAVQSNPGSWHHDGSFVYVRATTGTVFAATYQATAQFRFSTKPKVFANQFYDPRVLSIPNVSLRIEPRFGGVGQVGGGRVDLANNDAFFDTLTALRWDAGRVVIKMGVDTRTDEMAFGSYTTIGTWLVEDWEKNDERFRLQLVESKRRIEQDVPNVFYGDGDPMPIAYGEIRGIQPRLIDETTRTYEVANHFIKSFQRLQIKVDDVWQEIPFASMDLANGRFTLSSDQPEAKPVLSVDFDGKKDGAGSLMINPIDIIQDLLATIGETNIDSSSFATAKARLEVGADSWDRTTTIRRASIYLKSVRSVFSVIDSINELARTFLYVDANGQYHAGTWEPEVGENLTTFTDTDILDGTFAEILDAADVRSSIVLTYGVRPQTKHRQVVTLTNSRARYLHGSGSEITAEKELALTITKDAVAWSQYFLHERTVIRTFSMIVTWRGSLLKPGQQVRIAYPRHNLDLVLEVLSVTHDLIRGRIGLVLGDLRGFAGRAGFWVDQGGALPVRFASEPGYGSGSLAWNSGWSSMIKDWARNNVGYWTDANGFADSADPHSFIPSSWI